MEPGPVMEAIKRFFQNSWRLLKKDFRLIHRRTLQALVRRKWLAIGSMAFVCLVSYFLVHPYDRAVLEHIYENEDPALTRLANELGWWGDFAQFNLVGFLAIWLIGALLGNRWFQRLAVATFYGALLAGLSVNALRFSMGRPRPHAHIEEGIPDRFHGIPGVLRGWNYHGFPSGHTSTAMGMGTPVVTAGGVYGLPVFLFSCSVGWSRIYKKKHYPTDVLVGGAFGMIYGCAGGWHLRRIRLRKKRRK